MHTRGSNYKISRKGILCGLVIVIALMSNQTAHLFPNSGQSAYYFFLFARNIGTLALFFATSRYGKLPKNEIQRFIKLIFPVFVFFVCVEMIALFTSPIPSTYGIKYWTRSLSAFIDKLLTYLLVIGIWKYRGKLAIRCFTTAVLVNQFIVFLSVIYNHGFRGVINSFLNAFLFRGLDVNYFEVHELTFCIGFLVIYYLFFQERRKHIGLIILLVFFFLLGAKRIGLFGIIVAGSFSFLVKKKGLSKRMITVVGLSGVAICFIFLALIYNEGFNRILTTQGINDMGRGLIYRYFTRRTSFGPSYLGLGIAATSKMIENMDRAEVLYMQAVRGVHSSVLSDYINYGFLGYLFWSMFNLVYLPGKFFAFYGKKPATLYISFLIYAYITYLTDNTEGYFVFQTALLLIPISEYILEKYGLGMISKKKDVKSWQSD